MSDYKLTYFNGQGRAEIIRLVFAAAGVQYEDNRFEKDVWAELKPSTPNGQVPILETKEHKLFQSLAIARYLAKKHGLAGKTDWEELKVDIVVDTVEDLFRPVPQFWLIANDEKKKEELRNTYVKVTLPTLLKNLEKVLSANNNGDGYFVGDSVTWADLHFLTLISRVQVMAKLADPLAEFPKLKGLFERTSALPKIAAWIAKRPVTDF